MKSIGVTSMACLAIAFSTWWQDQPSSGQTSDDEALAAIRVSADEYVAAFNSRNAEKLAQLWSPQAVYVLPESGEQIVGREAVQAMFEELFAASPPTRLSVTVESVRLVTPDVAIESGNAQVVHPDGETTHSGYSAVHVKHEGKWLIDSLHDVDVTTEVAAASPLAALEWLVGEWLDESEGSTVETTCQWAKNHGFLTQNFRVSANGDEILEGTQVIGWDPIAGRIRSWVFDSAGGHMEGTWHHNGSAWVVESNGYTDDGSPVSSIQVLTPVDANSFKWQSFGRRVGSEVLPNIDEVSVIRKQQTNGDN